jgi:dihydrofolate reductase
VGNVIFDMSMSLDGYITATDRTPDEPLGKGGERLHGWAFGTNEKDAQFMADSVANLGAVIAGRTTYDESIRWWGPDGPSGGARRPVVVVTHEAPADTPEGGVYTFVTDGIEAALKVAREMAGEEDVTIMGGPSLGQQYLQAGLVDEISIHLIPVLFHGGKRMFDVLEGDHLHLQPIQVVDSPNATHLRYRVVK